MDLRLMVDKAKLTKKLSDLPDKIRRGIETALFKAGTIVQTESIMCLAGLRGHPRHWITGNLARSIQVKTRWESNDIVVAVVGSDVPYAIYVEALPDGGFLYTALMNKSNDAKIFLSKRIKELLK